MREGVERLKKAGNQDYSRSFQGFSRDFVSTQSLGESKLAPDLPRGPRFPVLGASLVLFGVGLLGGAGYLLTSKPRPEARLAVDPKQLRTRGQRKEELALDLARLVKDLEQSPALRRSFEFSADQDPELAFEAWKDARAAYRRVLSRQDWSQRVRAALAGEKIPRSWVSSLSRLALFQRILERHPHRKVPDLVRPGEDPDWAHWAATGARLREDPILRDFPREVLDPWTEGAKEFERRRQLRRGSWRSVRKLSQLLVFDPHEKTPNPGIRITTPFGTPFSDPVQKVPRFLVSGVFSDHEHRRTFMAPNRTRLGLDPFSGDLVLAGVVRKWRETTYLWVELQGQAEKVPVFFSLPSQAQGDGVVMRSVRLEVDQAWLPEGLRAAWVSLKAIPSVGYVGMTASLLEVQHRIAPESS